MYAVARKQLHEVAKMAYTNNAQKELAIVFTALLGPILATAPAT